MTDFPDPTFADESNVDLSQKDIGEPIVLDGDDIPDDLDVGDLDDLVAATSDELEEDSE